MPSSSRPNVLIILSDDHGYGDRSALGIDPAVQTPGLDRLAADGVSCTDAYVAAPICSPSRAAIISGAYPARWGSTWFGDTEFPNERASIAERFKELGYTTGYFGKVHYGSEKKGDRACPSEHGFDESYYGLAGQQQGRLNYLLHSGAAVAEYGPQAQWRMAVQPMLHNGEEAELDSFLTAELGRRARDFMACTPGPRFTMVAFNAVHNFCWQLPAAELEQRGLPARADWHDDDSLSYADWYDGAISPNLEHGREYYVAQLELMDAEISAMLESLDASGEAENTIVVYLTDNGGSTCNYGNNAPLSGTKYTLAEGGVRVPYLVRWPSGGWCGGRDISGLTSSMDLYPTLLAASGYDVSDLDCDGLDQGSLWRGDTHSGHESLHWETGFQSAVRMGNLKLRITHEDSAQARGVAEVEHVEVGDGVQLFDLSADIQESHDLLPERPDDVQRLWHRQRTWLTEMGRSDLAELHEERVTAALGSSRSILHVECQSPSRRPDGGWR